MDKKDFDDKIIHLGQFKKMTPGFDAGTPPAFVDLKFIPASKSKPCRDCNEVVEDRQVIYEVRWGRKGEAFWQKKCLNCGLKSKGMDL